MNIRIIVATTKDYWMPDDPVYLPLQVGAAGKPALGYARDDTGNNISAKNPNYCELTGLYWAWKNLDTDYLGLCHYRRYFAKGGHAWDRKGKKKRILGKADYERLLSRYDVILPEKRNYHIETVRSQYEHAHFPKDLRLAEHIVKEDYPAYSQAFDRVMAQKRLYLLNMFVMRKELVDQYCAWLFHILAKVEEEIDMTGYDRYEARVFGFLAERLFNVWLERQALSVAEVPVVNLERVNWPVKIAKFLKRKVAGHR